jgi:hypothetical protein
MNYKLHSVGTVPGGLGSLLFHPPIHNFISYSKIRQSMHKISYELVKLYGTEKVVCKIFRGLALHPVISKLLQLKTVY